MVDSCIHVPHCLLCCLSSSAVIRASNRCVLLFVHHVLLRGCSLAAKSVMRWMSDFVRWRGWPHDEHESEDADDAKVKEHCDACTSLMPQLWRSDGSDCACTKMLVSSKCAQQVQFAVSLQCSIRSVCVPSLCMVASACARELKM